MNRNALSWFGGLFVVATAALASACANDSPANPLAVASANHSRSVRADETGDGLPDLTACPQLVAPDGSTLVIHAFGIGFQVYHWNGSSWGAATPDAKIYANPGGTGQIATHFAGPSWQTNSGSKVVGTIANRCVPDPASIAWLSLTAVPSGSGLFAKVTFIQRLNTVGGNPPAAPGTTIGQEARIPYTADYLFYQAP